jgi:hypothetical protein
MRYLNLAGIQGGKDVFRLYGLDASELVAYNELDPAQPYQFHPFHIRADQRPLTVRYQGFQGIESRAWEMMIVAEEVTAEVPAVDFSFLSGVGVYLQFVCGGVIYKHIVSLRSEAHTRRLAVFDASLAPERRAMPDQKPYPVLLGIYKHTAAYTVLSSLKPSVKVAFKSPYNARRQSPESSI